jgi:hypothetical protein
MKAEELRIGNWVYFKDGECYSTVAGIIDGGEISVNYNMELLPIEDCFEPIPLTPEILEKIEGFEFKKKENVWEKDRYILVIKSNDEEWFINIQKEFEYCYISQYNLDDEIGSFYIHNKLYLHTLQNLIYSLTQTELQIKL